KTSESKMIPSNRLTNPLLAVAYALVLLLLLGSATADEEEVSMTVDEVVEMIEPFGEGCTPKPEREHIVEMVKYVEDAKHETKCFRHCLLEQFELMAEGEMQYNEDKTIEMLGMIFPDREDESRRIIKSCNDQAKGGTDKCEVAHGISICLIREMRTSGYKIPELKD
ncbi:hypothetical protein KR009_007898, partial [Drosophila setifemur]